MPDHPGLYHSIVQRLVDSRWRCDLVLVDLGWKSLIHDSAASRPRWREPTPLDTTLRKLLLVPSPPARTWRVVRFPGWPHGNRTHNGSISAACKAREVGRGDPTCPPPRARCYPCATLWRAPYGLLCYAGTAHRECVICSFAVLSLHFPGLQVSIISTLSADFDRQFDYGCHSRRTRDFGVRSHASFSRAIGGLHRGTLRDHFGIASTSRIRDASLCPSSRQPQSRRRDEER